jgi:hypothetical protein
MLAVATYSFSTKNGRLVVVFDLISDRSTAYQAQKSLRNAFARGATKEVQTLSTPGGRISNADILVRKDLDLWAHFATRADDRGVLLCWFGVGSAFVAAVNGN